MSESEPKPLTRDLAPFGLRIPPDLKERIRAAAEASNRSMNAEIVATLEGAYPVTEADFEQLVHMVARDGRTRETTIQGQLARLDRLDDGTITLTYLEPDQD